MFRRISCRISLLIRSIHHSLFNAKPRKSPSTQPFSFLSNPPSSIPSMLILHALPKQPSPLKPLQHDRVKMQRNTIWQLLRTALRGDSDAQFHIAQHYLHGSMGLPRNYTYAQHWFEHAAAQGHVLAQQQLNQFYQQLAFS